jgi:hypothetical protein
VLLMRIVAPDGFEVTYRVPVVEVAMLPATRMPRSKIIIIYRNFMNFHPDFSHVRLSGSLLLSVLSVKSTEPVTWYVIPYQGPI